MVPLDIFPLPKEAWGLGIGAIIAALIAAYVARQTRLHEIDKQSREILHDYEMKAQERAHQERLAYQERIFQHQTNLEDRAHDWQIKQAEWASGQSQVLINPGSAPDPSWLTRMPPRSALRSSRLPGAKAWVVIAVLLLGSCSVLSLSEQSNYQDTGPKLTLSPSPSPTYVSVGPTTDSTGLADGPIEPPLTPDGYDLNLFFEDVRFAADAQVDDPDPDKMRAYFDFPLGWFGGKPLSVKQFSEKLHGPGPNRIYAAEWVRTCWRRGDILKVYVKVPYEIRATGERPKPDKNLYNLRLTGDPNDPYRIVNIENGTC